MGEETKDDRRVAYIWSKELQGYSDKLPSNIGRSSMVHDLIKSFDLLSPGSRNIQQDHTPQNEVSEEGNTGNVREGEEAAESAEDGEEGDEVGRRIQEDIKPSKWARVVNPDMKRFGSEDNLKTYHDPQYVEYLLSEFKGSISEEEEAEEEDGEMSDGASTSSDRSYRPKKKRKTIHGLEHDCPRFPGLPTYSRLVAAATQTACQEIIDNEADIAICWDGGRHHAQRNRASGFCYVADIVLGILLLVKKGKPLSSPSSPLPLGSAGTTDGVIISSDNGISRPSRRARVMYIDLDIHEGDGVHSAFLSPTHFPPSTTDPATVPDDSSRPKKSRKPKAPSVLTLSIHHHSKTFFPPHKTFSGLPDQDTSHPFTLSIPLHGYPSKETYAEIWPSVEEVKKALQPDYIVLQLGVDGMPGDRVGQYGAWGIEGKGGLRWCVDRVREWRVPLCVVGGGGYDHPNTARAWTVATSVLLNRPLSSDTEIPHHEHFPLYSPSFTLDIPQSHAKDENTPEYLQSIRETYKIISDRIRDIVSP